MRNPASLTRMWPLVGKLITLLEQKRCIDVARSLQYRAMPDSLVTERGEAEAQRLRERRADPAARLRYAHGAFGWPPTASTA
jgi:hypothetical protein